MTFRKATSECRWLFMLFISCFWLMGWTDSWTHIRTETAGIETVTARFVQTKHLKILSKPLRSEGIIYYQAPDSLRWEYRTPQPSVTLTHRGKTERYFKTDSRWVRDAGSNLQVMQYILVEIKHWLSGRFDENPGFQPELKADHRIVLTPKDQAVAAMIERIELVLSATPGVITTVTIFENQDSYTHFVFEDTRLNDPIDPLLFQRR
jgi:outer membrane lipoprotein carrier protein